MKNLPGLFAFVALLAIPAGAEELIPNGGFELPIVSGKLPKDKGGDPSKGGKSAQWIGFEQKPGEQGGTVVAGLTNEFAHGGVQSLYVKFSHVTLAYQNAALQTRMIPVLPGGSYRAGIWGRLDPKDPIKMETRIPYVKTQIDFYNKDGTEPAGEAAYSVQPIPGSKNRDPFFSAEKWKEVTTGATAPDDAGFAQITWRWETGSEEGETNGTIYFDDATFTGPPALDPNAKPATNPETDVSPEGMTAEPDAEATPEDVTAVPEGAAAKKNPKPAVSPSVAPKASPSAKPSASPSPRKKP